MPSTHFFSTISQAVQGAWILLTGFWNDAGVWDDSSFWID